MKKKICFIVPKLGEGGAEKVAYNLLNNLDLNKFEIELIIIYKEKGDYLKNLRKEVKCIFLNKNKIRNSLISIFMELKKSNPEIVIVFSFEIIMLIGMLLIPFFKNIKFINRQINLIEKLKLSKLKKFLLIRAYKNIDRVITQSKDMTNDLENNLKIDLKNKIVEINNPINIDEILNLSNEKIEIELKRENRNLLCVGRLSKQKAFDLIIEIMVLFKNTNIKLYILGEGEERLKLQKLIEKNNLYNNVFLLGRKENPYVYMRNADLFILSSRYEGFPNVLLEAGACGLYSICNDSPGGINEIVEENINGNIVDFKNEKLVERIIIEKLDEIKDKKLIEKSISDRYSMNIIIKKYEKLLKEL